MAHGMRPSDLDLATAGMLDEAKKHQRGPAKKPPKVVKRIEYERAANGTHVFTHHHTHPEQHPAQQYHYKPDKEKPRAHDDEAVDHFIHHAIAPNEGEGEMEPESEGASGKAAAPPEEEEAEQ